MFKKYSLLFMLSMFKITEGSVRFTQEPPKVVYVLKGNTARLVWEYHVDNRDRDFDINSPKWNFYNKQGGVMNIASEDMFQNWKWVIHKDTCPPRLLNPTRVFKESLATLVIKNVSPADNGVYGCSLVLLRTSLPINSKVTLSVIEKAVVSNIVSTTSATTKQPTSPTLKENASAPTINSEKQPNLPVTNQGNVTNILKTTTDVDDVALLWKGIPMINKTMSDHIVKSWNNKSSVLRCIINGPARPNITWYNPNGQDITNDSHPTKDGSQLFVLTLRGSDYGIYTCRAENRYGFDVHSINVTNSCLCPTKISLKAAALMQSKDSPSGTSNPGLKYKKLYITCLAIIGVSWTMNVFLILLSRTMPKPKIRSNAYCMADMSRKAPVV